MSYSYATSSNITKRSPFIKSTNYLIELAETNIKMKNNSISTICQLTNSKMIKKRNRSLGNKSTFIIENDKRKEERKFLPSVLSKKTNELRNITFFDNNLDIVDKIIKSEVDLNVNYITPSLNSSKAEQNTARFKINVNDNFKNKYNLEEELETNYKSRQVQTEPNQTIKNKLNFSKRKIKIIEPLLSSSKIEGQKIEEFSYFAVKSPSPQNCYVNINYYSSLKTKRNELNENESLEVSKKNEEANIINILESPPENNDQNINFIDLSEIKRDEELNFSIKNSQFLRNNTSLINSFLIMNTKKENKQSNFINTGLNNTINKTTPKISNMNSSNSKIVNIDTYGYIPKTPTIINKYNLLYDNGLKLITSKSNDCITNSLCKNKQMKISKSKSNFNYLSSKSVGNDILNANSSSKTSNEQEHEQLEDASNSISSKYNIFQMDIVIHDEVKTMKFLKDLDYLNDLINTLALIQNKTDYVNKDIVLDSYFLSFFEQIDNYELFDVLSSSKTYIDSKIKEEAKLSIFLLFGIICFIIIFNNNKHKSDRVKCFSLIQTINIKLKEAIMIIDSLISHMFLMCKGNINKSKLNLVSRKSVETCIFFNKNFVMTKNSINDFIKKSNGKVFKILRQISHSVYPKKCYFNNKCLFKINKVITFVNNYSIEGVISFQEFIIDDIILDGIYNEGVNSGSLANLDNIANNARDEFIKDNSSLSIEINLESFDIKSLRDDNNKIILSYLPNESIRKYTLVIDFDGILLHLSEKEFKEPNIILRPNLDNFLNNISKFYEIVIFTCAFQEYADCIIDKFDKGRVSHRLYKQHTIVKNNSCIKDLSRLGRDIEKIVIIDNLSNYYIDFASNGLNILSYYGSHKDDELSYINHELVEMARKNLNDLRPEIRNIQLKLVKRNQLQLEKLLK